jgi:muconolactone delta-isomerase
MPADWRAATIQGVRSHPGKVGQGRDQMRVLAIERPVAGVTDDSFTSEVLVAEAERVWQLHQDGRVRELYFRDDESSAVLALESASVQEARDVLGSLPLVSRGLIEFEVIPLRAYPGFERLFGPRSAGEP